MKNKFCREILSLIFMMLLFSHAGAQQKPLKIGDALPEKIWRTPLQVVNAPQKTMTLSADQDKLILLDFWATWCSSCLKAFPKMENLQQHYGDRIKILAVSSQDRATLEKFFASKNGQRFKGMVSVTDDQLFTTLFPHAGVPFIVWIKNGKLLNTTDGDQVSEKTIAEVLNDSRSSLQTVVQRDDDGPLMISSNLHLEKGFTLNHYTFFGKGRVRGLGYGTKFHREAGKTYGRQFTNLSLLEIYRAIAQELFNQNGEKLNVKRIHNLVEHREKIDFTPDSENESQLYSVDYLVPKAESDSLYRRMLRMVNENTAYHAIIQKKPTKCLVLKRTSTQDKIATKGGVSINTFLKNPSVLQNTTLDFMLSALNANNDFTALPVIDETGYQGNVDLRFSAIKDLKTLQKDLAAYDLALEETERDLNVLVIEDKKPLKP
ncbi:TlpA family protein disulfide reductase [Kaistella flava (ex Peng et al. 2021)]|uniref:TlpA family protein disulfide reductase n=1 Tax=Kaistella flava (ex Peng et al. 2021) TaxID=2038776 RepID=A0A7M2Y6P3_9FLAO|nr:TlpA disulfide reductase family protein [Kaistella flava (ex Peng et al. 2021)]QOW09918.1 TlpA family protein disulfide reductase [Kaistella flava (ex Peng et al. 2021)]